MPRIFDNISEQLQNALVPTLHSDGFTDSVLAFILNDDIRYRLGRDANVGDTGDDAK